jgi:hypothetical protein
MRLTFSLLAAFTLACLCSAHAGVRDDVMSAAFHCSRIGDSHLWLDCYYGAAQSVRARLGLLPAPENQTRLAASPPEGGKPQDQPIRDQIMAAAVGCNDFADDREWLNCYYGASQPIRASMGLPPIAGPQPSHPSGSQDQLTARSIERPAPDQNRGLFSDLFGAKDTPRLISPLTSYKFDKEGVFRVTLANGQVWRQLSGDTDYAKWKKPAGSYVAMITHGAFGSYNFQIQDLPGVYKVARVK